jgi:LmbE family N-acetylglucosaminyl deacetylase
VNNGLTTDDLQTLLADALHWAREQYLFVVATNGARDTNYEIDDPRGIDDERAKWLIKFATILEVRDGLEIYLRSPDDVFVRNE